MLVVAAAGCSGGSGDDRGGSGADGGSGESGAAADDTTTAETDGPAALDEVVVLAADDPGFYEVPEPLPAGRHGDLLRVQPVAGAPDGTTWQRIMYLSETVTGEPTVVTGILTLPEGEPPDGGWPLFSHAHGSTGLADPCAPSVSLAGDQTFAIEILLLSSHVANRGIAVVSTDYEGLGGPGRHPFLIGESEGRGVLDAILAAREVPDTNFAAPVGIIGYSQGGHAAAWANQIAPDWTPDLDIVGVLAGAPATEVPEMVAGSDSAGLLMVAALATTGDDFDPTEILTTDGLAVLEQVDAVCQDELQPVGTLLSADVSTTEPWAGGLAAQVPGDEPGAAPVLVVHSAVDLNVPVEGSAAFQDRLCGAGQVVERRVLPEGDHVAAAVPAYEQGIDWITGLAAGASPRSTCP